MGPQIFNPPAKIFDPPPAPQSHNPPGHDPGDRMKILLAMFKSFIYTHKVWHKN